VLDDVERLIRELSIVMAYIEAFEEAGSDAQSVFLRLIGTDIVKYKEVRRILKLSFNEIKSLFASAKSGSLSSTTDLVKQVSNIALVLDDLSTTTGSEFEFHVRKFFSKETPDSSLEKYKLPPITDAANVYDLMKILKDKNLLHRLLEDLSSSAGKYLFSLLTYGSINLAKNDVKEGDILYLNIVWKNFRDQMADSLKKRDEEALPIGTYKIEQTGWTTNVAESFYLIERFDEPDRISDDRVSPSNFKGAAGVSLMRTYNYSEPGINWGNKFFNWLQPSVGLNLSYIDFYTTKDLELGLGFQLGIFKNSIFLGYGVNLNGIRSGEGKSNYFMLGLSFINLASKFRSSNE
jgi:hypothetical protein